MLGLVSTFNHFHTLSPRFITECQNKLETINGLSPTKLAYTLSESPLRQDADRLTIYLLGIMSHQIMGHVTSPTAHEVLAIGYRWGMLQQEIACSNLSAALPKMHRGWNETPITNPVRHKTLEFAESLTVVARSFAYWEKPEPHASNVAKAFELGHAAMVAIRLVEGSIAPSSVMHDQITDEFYVFIKSLLQQAAIKQAA